MVPVALKEPFDVLHVTPAPPTSFVTVAVNASDCPVVNPPRCGVRLTLIVPLEVGATVMVAALFFDVSVTDVAVRVTVAGVGTAAGAVYVIATPELLDAADIAPHVAPLHPVPESAHVTPWASASFVTVAVIFRV